eukprot:scaffold666878_cov48-Prasinocladus_malaysianus.AAC.1
MHLVGREAVALGAEDKLAGPDPLLRLVRGLDGPGLSPRGQEQLLDAPAVDRLDLHGDGEEAVHPEYAADGRRQQVLQEGLQDASCVRTDNIHTT